MKTEEKTIITSFCDHARAVIDTESKAIESLKSRIDTTFAKACKLMLACEGRIVVMGMGKSGHIGKKIAATMASTGTPAFFIHPAEACHGDLGMITLRDVVLTISNSGETPEMLNTLPLINRFNLPHIALTGNPHSTLAKHATAHLDVSVDQEACPLGLAPTTSTTVALVMGDALAVALLEARGFNANDFASFHPAGALGKRLLLRVGDIMHKDEEAPAVDQTCLLDQALIEITQKRLGMTTVIDTQRHVLGIFTDGDLRRTLDHKVDVRTTPIHQVMSENPITIHANLLAADALQLMQKHKITSLVVTHADNSLHGVVHLHDVLRAGVV